MYLEHFGLQESPFRMTPDARYLFLSQAHSRAMAYMEYTLWNRDSFVLITGDIGSGKTTLIQKLLAELDTSTVTVANIFQTQLDPTEFLQALLVEFGFKPYRAKKVELLNTLNKFLEEENKKGHQVVVIIDDAQNLSREVLEEIRMLASLEVQKQRVMNIILCGQPELNDTLEDPSLEQLSQRIRLRFHIRALEEEQVKQYIEYRLSVAAGEELHLFNDDVMPIIYKYTGGVPRLINTLCDTALLGASVEEEKEITVERIENSVDELNWVPFTERRIQQRARAKVGGPVVVPASNKPRLIVKLDNLLIGEYPLDKTYFAIGRMHTSDVRLEGSRVSGLHALVYTTESETWLIDLHSTNGTFVNGKRVTRYKLSHGDTFEVTKKYHFKYVESDDSSDGDRHTDQTIEGAANLSDVTIQKLRAG